MMMALGTVVLGFALVVLAGLAVYTGWKMRNNPPPQGSMMDTEEFFEAGMKPIFRTPNPYEFEKQPVLVVPTPPTEINEKRPEPVTGPRHDTNHALATSKINTSDTEAIDRSSTLAGKLTLGNRLYKLADEEFTAHIDKNGTFAYGVLYLLDSDGNVHGFCTAAKDSKYPELKYTPDMFEGSPFIYSASNTGAMNAFFG